MEMRGAAEEELEDIAQDVQAPAGQAHHLSALEALPNDVNDILSELLPLEDGIQCSKLPKLCRASKLLLMIYRVNRPKLSLHRRLVIFPGMRLRLRLI